MNKELLVHIFIMSFVLVGIFYMDMRFTHAFVPTSDDCEMQHGISFSNSTRSALYKFGDTCFGWTNQGDNFPKVELKKYAYEVDDE